MGGIAAVFHLDGRPVEIEVLRAVAGAAAGRGPGGIRHRLTGEAGLAYLALDASREAAGGQPLERGRRWIVADARLDNRDELESLLGEHLEGSPASDAELILAAYRRWGNRCPNRLLGDFAFAIWDPQERRAFCARDPLGIKPLHYARIGPLLCVASEAQQVLNHPAVPRRLDEVTVGLYLCEWADDPERTFFRDVRWLPPAHRLIAAADHLRLERYWDIDPEKRTVYRRNEDYAVRLRDLLLQAVSDRLGTSGRAVGVAMSGGLDSCTVAALARRQLARSANGAPRLVAASLVFDHLDSCDESTYVQAMSAELDFEVVRIDAERHWFLGDPADHRPSLESPFITWQSSLREILRRLRDRGARVLLTGQGGDEALGGSGLVFWDRLRRGDLRAVGEVARHARRRRWGLAWTLYQAFGVPLLAPGADRMLRRLLRRRLPDEVPRWIAPQLLRRTGLRERSRARPPRRFREAARQEIYDWTVGSNCWVRSVYWYDRNAARFGIEARHPFLDRRVIEFVHAIPPDLLCQLGSYKPLLRQAAAGVLPDVVRLRADKTSLAGFQDYSLREKAGDQIDELLAAPLSAELGLVDGRGLRAAYREYRTTPPDDATTAVWTAICFELWLQRHHGTWSGNSEPDMI